MEVTIYWKLQLDYFGWSIDYCSGCVQFSELSLFNHCFTFWISIVILVSRECVIVYDVVTLVKLMEFTTHYGLEDAIGLFWLNHGLLLQWLCSIHWIVTF